MPFFENGTWYPYEEFINGTLADMGAYNSQITGYVFGYAILGLVYLVFLIAGTAMGRKDGLAVNASASFVVWMVSILMVAMESPTYGGSWLPQETLYLTTFIMIFSVAVLYFGKR